MATNVSDDGSAPVDFNLSSTVETTVNKNSDICQKCLLCNNLRSTFYCKLCVANGDFVSSNPQNPGTLFLFILHYVCETFLNAHLCQTLFFILLPRFKIDKLRNR